MKKIILSLLSSILFLSAIAQNKDVLKARKLYEKGSDDKAFAIIRELMVQYPNNTTLYEELITMYAKRFQQNAVVNENFSSFSAEGQNIFVNMTEQNEIAGQYLNSLVQVLREATLKTRSTDASTLLRTILVDKPFDENINETAKQLFKNANKLYEAGKFKESAVAFKKALLTDTSYYLAKTFCGISYLKSEEPDSAKKYLRMAVNTEPELLIARKYYIDALTANKDFNEALDFCIASIFIYPDESLLYKLNIIKKYIYEGFNLYWMPRPYYPLSIKNENEEMTISPWNVYQKAKEDIQQYCNGDGIVTTKNRISRYDQMEIYAWEKMLNSPECRDKQFDVAKKMMARGYLDCYVMFSMFHYDFYEQYKNFVKNNPEKMKKYLSQVLSYQR